MRQPLTNAESPAAAVITALAATIAGAYALDRVGLPFPPGIMFAVAAAAMVSALIRFRTFRATRAPIAEAVAFWAIVIAATGWLVWRARPWILPLGHGPDLTHHLQLIGFIERHWRLVHAPGVEPYLGEMVSYTPGLHVLAALTGAWTGRDGLHVLHPLLSGLVALKMGVVYLIALRLLPPRVPRVALALCAVGLLLVPRTYVLGSFIEGSFLAQVASELFAVAMWWALVVWDQSPSPTAATIFGVAGVATFLTWPIWIGPPTVALVLIVWLRGDLDIRVRAKHGLVALGPIVAVSGIYLTGRLGWLRMANSGGAVLTPQIALFGPWFVALAMIGVLVALRLRAARATLFVLGAIALQAAALAVWAATSGNRSFYMAFKTFYLFPYPMAVLAVYPLASLCQALARSGITESTFPVRRQWSSLGAALLVGLVLRVSAWPIVREPRLTPPLTEPLFRAGAWARAHLPAGCLEYMVADDDTAYWLHLAVLGNPRWSARAAADETYDLGATVIRWLAPTGLPYAIADLPALNHGVRRELDIVAQFETAAVVKRRGSSSCADADLAPAP